MGIYRGLFCHPGNKSRDRINNSPLQLISYPLYIYLCITAVYGKYKVLRTWEHSNFEWTNRGCCKTETRTGTGIRKFDNTILIFFVILWLKEHTICHLKYDEKSLISPHPYPNHPPTQKTQWVIRALTRCLFVYIDYPGETFRLWYAIRETQSINALVCHNSCHMVIKTNILGASYAFSKPYLHLFVHMELVTLSNVRVRAWLDTDICNNAHKSYARFYSACYVIFAYHQTFNISAP